MTPTHPSRPFTGRSSSRRCSTGRTRAFDAFVGNPPFAGKNAVAAGNVGGYPDWLKTRHEESHGNADLVAHFFRRAFDLVRAGGTFGLIATNTIAQGDTRSSGLRWICEHGGEIYRATKRYQWPGEAAVVVSVLHVAKTGEARDERAGSRNVEAADSEDKTRDGLVSWKKGARRGEGRRHHRFPVPPGRPR